MEDKRLFIIEVKEVAESMTKSERTELIEGVIALFRDKPNNTDLGEGVDVLVKRIVGKQ